MVCHVYCSGIRLKFTLAFSHFIDRSMRTLPSCKDMKLAGTSSPSSKTKLDLFDRMCQQYFKLFFVAVVKNTDTGCLQCGYSALPVVMLTTIFLPNGAISGFALIQKRLPFKEKFVLTFSLFLANIIFFAHSFKLNQGLPSIYKHGGKPHFMSETEPSRPKPARDLLLRQSKIADLSTALLLTEKLSLFRALSKTSFTDHLQ